MLDHQTDEGGRGDSVMLVYDGGVVDEADLQSVPASEEGRGVAFVDPADLVGATLPRLAQRVRAALIARDTERFVEMINGDAR